MINHIYSFHYQTFIGYLMILVIIEFSEKLGYKKIISSMNIIFEEVSS